MKPLDNKRLLIISSDGNDIEFIKSAKEMGVYTICCDRYTDWNISPAKLLADEAWDIDYTDIDTVLKKCAESKVDGVIAGYGEDRVAAASRISKALGTPFYATEEQIDFTRNKRLFKETCSRIGINVPKEFCTKLPISDEDLSRIKYPVIVKPSDNGGRKGISVCQTEEQLMKAIPLAESNSKNGEIVIEEYIKGYELSSVYTMVDGEISLSCLNDKYGVENESEFSTLCHFVITPSRFYEKYIKDIDPGIKVLLKEIGANNGMAYFQLIATDEKIYAFEMGLRMNGNNDFKVIRKYNDIDHMKMLISYSISGEMGDNLAKDNPQFSEYYSTLIIHLKSGTIGKINIEGLNEIKNIDDIFIWKKAGDVVLPLGTNVHKTGMIKFFAKTKEEIAETVNAIYDKLVIEDIDGNDMLMTRFNANRLFTK